MSTCCSLLWALVFFFCFFRVQCDINRTGCNRTVDAGDVLSNPLLTGFNKGRPYNCWFLVKPRATNLQKDVASVIIVLKFQRFQWGQLVNATNCVGGYLEIYDGQTALHDSGNPGFYCGEIERTRLFISENNIVKLHFFAESYDDRYQFIVTTRQEQQQQLVERYGHHPSLYPHRRGQPITPGSLSCDREFTDCRLQTCFVQSPNFPGVYPRNRRCLYHISTRQPFIKLFTEDGEFSVDGQRCDNYIMCPLRPINEESCPHDYIRVYDGNSESSVVIGTFCGIGRFPFSIIGTGTDLLLEFVSSPAGPLLNTGFHFNVDSWPGNVGNVFNQHMVQQSNERFSNESKINSACSYVFTSAALESSGDSEGLFLSPMHWYPPNTMCTYLIAGRPGQVVRVYFPTFRISKPDAPIKQVTGDCSESLTIYDGSDANPTKIVKTFCDTFSKPMERKDFLSSGHSLLIRFHSRIGSYSGSSIHFWAHYDFFNNSQAEGQRSSNTDCDVVYDPTARSTGVWTSPVNTLLYKRGPDSPDLKCRYTFQGNQRNASRVLLTINSLNLKSVAYPCADRLVFRDLKNELTILDMNSNKLKATGNFTSTKGKGYLCQLQFQTSNLTSPVRILSSTSSIIAALNVDAQRSTLLYFKSSLPLFSGRYDFIHPLYICGSTRPNVTVDGVISLPQYMEDEDMVSPLVCAWDFVVPRESKKQIGNDSASLYLHIEISGALNLTRVQKSSYCSESSGNLLEVTIPGSENPMLLLCSKVERTSDFFKGMRLKESFDDLEMMKEQSHYSGSSYDSIRPSGFSTTLPLIASKMPNGKAVVMVKLNNLKTSYGVRISWSRMQ